MWRSGGYQQRISALMTHAEQHLLCMMHCCCAQLCSRSIGSSRRTPLGPCLAICSASICTQAEQPRHTSSLARLSTQSADMPLYLTCAPSSMPSGVPSCGSVAAPPPRRRLVPRHAISCLQRPAAPEQSQQPVAVDVAFCGCTLSTQSLHRELFLADRRVQPRWPAQLAAGGGMLCSPL